MPEPTPNHTASHHFLVIEDCKFDQKRVERILARAMDVHLSFVGTLNDAWIAVDATDFDLVVTDNALPDGLGISFVRRMRRTPNLQDVPILMISDHPSLLLQDRARQAGVSTVVAKSQLQPHHFRDAMRRVPELM